MLVSKTVLVERVFSIFFTEDDGETWKPASQVFDELRCAIDFCEERNDSSDPDLGFIVVPSDRTDASVRNVL